MANDGNGNGRNGRWRVSLQSLLMALPTLGALLYFLFLLGNRESQFQDLVKINLDNTQQVRELKDQVIGLKQELAGELQTEAGLREDIRQLTTAIASQNDRLTRTEDALYHDEKAHDEWATAHRNKKSSDQ